MKEENTQKVNTFAAMNKRLDDMHNAMEGTFKEVSSRFDVIYEDMDVLGAEIAESNFKHSEHIKDILQKYSNTLDNQLHAINKIKAEIDQTTVSLVGKVVSVEYDMKINTRITYISAGLVMVSSLVGLGFLLGGFL